ncbi:MAG: hypothetical protein Q9196_007230, partial [Gyalolechia fulgens]
DQFAPLDQRVDGFAETVDKRIGTLDRELRSRLSSISESLKYPKPSVPQGWATIEERLRHLDEQSTEHSECLRHLDEQSTENLECLHDLDEQSTEQSECLQRLDEQSTEQSECLQRLDEQAKEQLQGLGNMSEQFAKRLDEKLQVHDHHTKSHVKKVEERLIDRLDKVSHNVEYRWSLMDGKLMNLEDRLENARLAILDGSIQQVSTRIEELKAAVHAGYLQIPIPFPCGYWPF